VYNICADQSVHGGFMPPKQFSTAHYGSCLPLNKSSLAPLLACPSLGGLCPPPPFPVLRPLRLRQHTPHLRQPDDSVQAGNLGRNPGPVASFGGQRRSTALADG
jgi:hypothetical protein